MEETDEDLRRVLTAQHCIRNIKHNMGTVAKAEAWALYLNVRAMAAPHRSGMVLCAGWC